MNLGEVIEPHYHVFLIIIVISNKQRINPDIKNGLWNPRMQS